MSDLKQTPFHKFFEAKCNEGSSWDAWAGYHSALEVEGYDKEYNSVRTDGCGVIDVTPMMKYDFAGPDAAKFLDYMLTRRVSTMKVGGVVYTAWTNENGKMLDDGTVYRMGDNEFRLLCAEDQMAWMDKISSGFDVTYTDVTHTVCGIAIQGKAAYSALCNSGITGLEDMKAFQFKDLDLAGVTVTVSRTGFTGDLGYEIAAANEHAELIWNEVVEKNNMVAIGLTSWDVMRQECAYILPGVDCGVADSNAEDRSFERTPYEMDFAWMVQLDREEFMGQAALKAAKDNLEHDFLGVALDDDSDTGVGSLYGATLRNEAGEEIGTVTSGGYAALLKRNIGIATAKAGSVSVGSKVLIGDDKAAGKVVKRPFFSTDRRTQTPPPK